jgi:sigma-E factor negative regulatory protein RseB
MLRIGWITGTLVASAMACAGGAQLPAAKGMAEESLSDPHAVVRRIQGATSRRNYTGTFVVNAAGMISSSRITHYADGRNQVERIEALDGQMRRVYRHNDAVHVLWPITREASIEQRQPMPGFPNASLPEGQAGLGMYDVHALTDDRVAGHAAQVVLFRPRDANRYAQRLWLERHSGLLLRADMLGMRGEVIESSAFSELHLDIAPQPQSLLNEMRRLEGYRVQRPQLLRADLEHEGWTMRSTPPGFAEVRCVRRPLRSTERTGTTPESTGAPQGSTPLAAYAAPPAASGPPLLANSLLQVMYSDGLTLVSVFVEPFEPTAHRREAPISWGATQALSRRLGDWWITVVGDVPLATLQQFSSGMERRKS